MYKEGLFRHAILACMATILLAGCPGGGNITDPGAWEKSFSGRAGWDVQETIDGGYVIIGTTGPGVVIDAGPFLMKTDAVGTTLWSTPLSTAGFDAVSAFFERSDGSFIVVGRREDIVQVARLDASGDVVWYRALEEGGGLAYPSPAVYQVSDERFVVITYADPTGYGRGDARVVQLDGDGVTQWTRVLDFADDVYANGVAVSEEGTLTLSLRGFDYARGTGGAKFSPLGTVQTRLVQLSFDGETTLERISDTAEPFFFDAPVLVGDGGYLSAGYREIVKYDALLEEQWRKPLALSLVSSTGRLKATSNGGFIAGATRYVDGLFFTYLDINPVVVALDGEGELLWEREHGTSAFEELYSVEPTSDGGYILLGERTSGVLPTIKNMYLLKVDPD